jgi:hypothetical protein
MPGFAVRVVAVNGLATASRSHPGVASLHFFDNLRALREREDGE